MSIESDLEIFERAVASGGRLLRVEADRLGPRPEHLVLTFDIGRIGIRTRDGALAVEHYAERAELPEGLLSLAEEEPWWRLLGHPLTAVWPGEAREGAGAVGLTSASLLKLRFRQESENPRVVVLEAGDGSLAVSLEK